MGGGAHGGGCFLEDVGCGEMLSGLVRTVSVSGFGEGFFVALGLQEWGVL
jgi:hypothetical protein